jgi:hypothetical protein
VIQYPSSGRHCSVMFMGEGMDQAERLITVLCAVAIQDWRDAAFAAANDPQASEAASALEIALAVSNPVLLWDLFDDLDTALYRLTTVERFAANVSTHEREVIRTTSRNAVGALVCAERLAGEHLMTLIAPFVELE